ncbi:MAG: ABC transporter substrate-binding protein [Actinomycetota bacterium]|nr:ABC transporter substrate-binding protein [Actinomycetota bacterium]
MIGIQRVRPKFVATNVITGEDRTDRVVLEANPGHNTSRQAKLAKVVFINDMSPEQALDAVCDREGEVDIVTEVSPADARRVKESEYAKLVSIEANRVLVGIFNAWPDVGAPFADRRVREAFNCAVDRDQVVSEGLGGWAKALGALTPPWSGGGSGAEPRSRDAVKAKQLLDQVGWPKGQAVTIATPAPFEGIARLIASDVEQALGITAQVVVIPAQDLTAGALTLIEKKLPPPWDILIHAWFDLSSDLPPAVMHREFFGDDGGFRAGPTDPEFNRRFDDLVNQTTPQAAQQAAQEIDRYCSEESKALFLCAPHALYAVNKDVDFRAYKTTFELADTTVTANHWSRRNRT